MLTINDDGKPSKVNKFTDILLTIGSLPVIFLWTLYRFITVDMSVLNYWVPLLLCLFAITEILGFQWINSFFALIGETVCINVCPSAKGKTPI